MMKKLFSFTMLTLALTSMSAMADIPNLMDGTDAAAVKQSKEARGEQHVDQSAESGEAMNMLNIKVEEPHKKVSEPSPYLTEMIYRF